MNPPAPPNMADVLPIIMSLVATYGTQILKYLKDVVIPNMELPLRYKWVKAILNSFLGALLSGSSGVVLGAQDPAMLALAGAGIGAIQALGYRYEMKLPGVKNLKKTS